MRRQLGRLRRAVLVAAAATAAGTAFLATTPRTGTLGLVLLAFAAIYLLRKWRQDRWVRQSIKQLRLEEQFIQHGPAPKAVPTCIRRRHHMWTHSLTLQSLRRLTTHPPDATLDEARRQAHVCAAFRRSFRKVRPGRVPVDLLWFVALVGFWLWALPEALLAAPSPLVLMGVLCWLPALGAEVVLAIFQADLRAGFATLINLLGRWTLAREFETLVETAQQQAYQHTQVYHAYRPRPPATLTLA